MKLHPALRPSALEHCLGLWLAGLVSVSGWTPGGSNPTAVAGLAVDSLNRSDVLSFYHASYAASENYAATMAFTGNVATGVAGTTSATFKDDVRRRINFYRALCGLPADIVFDSAKSSKDQEAALMFSRNNQLSHTPPTSWVYYTTNGSNAANASIIALGNYGPAAVDAFMRDTGAINAPVGHRRWLCYSQAQEMGTGDFPAQGSYASSNAIWVIGNPKPAPPPQFVAWPNRGYVPQQLVPARWSLSYPGANFANATVSMSQAGTTVATTIVSKTDNGYADNTLVWEPVGVPAAVTADLQYAVTVSNITIGGVATSYSYNVTLFDTNVLGDAMTITGTATPPTTGAVYAFNSIPQVDAYRLQVTTASTAAWTEGAELAPAPRIATATTGGYAVAQDQLPRTGSMAFHLAFADFTDQSFSVSRDIVPSANSELRFYERARFTTTTSTLQAEVSTDNGSSWTVVWSRNGVGGNSALWDYNYLSRNVNLAAYAGKTLQVRLTMRYNGQSAFIGATADFGFYIDDITITNASELVSPLTSSIASSETKFSLNATTAGAPLGVGNSYYMRMQAQLGGRWFGYGPSKIVAPIAANGFQTWAAAQMPVVTGGATEDHDADGFANGVEYAFGMNPTVANPASAMPQPIHNGSTYGVTFTQPAGISGVTYGMQWSRDFTIWSPLTDSGSGTSHTFSMATSGEPKLFFRHQIQLGP